MLNRKLTGLERRALALKYAKCIPDEDIKRELGRELGPKLLLELLQGALRKLKTGGLSDFRLILKMS